VTTTPFFDSLGASYFRFIGLDITTNCAIQQTQLVRLASSLGNGHHMILDRSLVHGCEIPNAPDVTGANQVQAGVTVSGDHLAVIDSYIYDIYCLNPNQICIDAQAIIGGNGTNLQGTIKIVNNFLEASGENFIFAGN